MTAVDFVVTIAIGSLLANAITATSWSAFFQALGAVTALVLLQKIISFLRHRSHSFKKALENDPLMVMRDGKFIQDALEKTQVTEGDIIAKLREANALDFSKVRAVVLETTGDISVMHSDELDERVLEGVRREN